MGEQIKIDFQKTRFAGADYKPARDKERLSNQIGKIHQFMSDGKWHTLEMIAKATGAPHASVSAQLRNLRKAPHKKTIERRYIKDGLYEYRMVPDA